MQLITIRRTSACRSPRARRTKFAGIVFAVVAVVAVVAPGAALAEVPHQAPPLVSGTNFRVYRVMEVPTPAGTPANVVPYATLAGVGNGTRLGDPAVLQTRAGINARQEWWFAPMHYPDNTVTGVSTGFGAWLKRCFYYYVVPKCVPFNSFDGPPSLDITVRAKIVSRYSGKCLTVSGSSLQPSPIVQDTCVAGARDQIWSFFLRGTEGHPAKFGAYDTPEVSLEPLSNNQTCLGPPARTVGTDLRLLGEDVPCPLWRLRPVVRDHRLYPNFENEF